MKIAVPIIARGMEEALYDIERASGVADILELRIDYMERPDLKRLLSSSPLPKIVTNRVAGEGGEFQGSEDERFAYLEEAADLGAEYVDVELNYLRRIPRKSTKLIVSHHLGEMPDNLQEIYRNIRRDLGQVSLTLVEKTGALGNIKKRTSIEKDNVRRTLVELAQAA